MSSDLPLSVLAGAAALSILAGCSMHHSAGSPLPDLELQQGSARMMIPVEPDGTVSLAEHFPLMGYIQVGPILEAEGQPVGEVQVLMHMGRFYVTAEQFTSIWEVIPRPGESRAAYRAIPVSGEALTGILLSRYGTKGRTCVRMDLEGSGPYYVNSKGRIDETCS